MTTPGRLEVDRPTGHATGPISIHYNDPFPCVNGNPNTTGAMQGVLMHTMVGNLPGTDADFNKAGFNASANFGIAQDGTVKQWGPLGKGWMAWHAEAANLTWYGIEHADDGNPDHPLTDKQLDASAQIVELLSRFAGFPLRVTNRPAGSGYGTHVMGGLAWSHDRHTCPDLPPRHVRSQQRAHIIQIAKAIRHPVAPPYPPGVFHADGHVSLADVAARQKLTVPDVLWSTARGDKRTPPVPGPLQTRYVDAPNWQAPMPQGMILWLP